MPFYQQDAEQNFKKAIHIAEQKKEQSLFVFDIDSTLFCMKHRTQAIIRDCLKDSEFCKKFPEYLNTIKRVEVTETDWSVEDIMLRYGFPPDEPFVSVVKKIWRKGFFSNDYLHLDKPYKGCVQYLQHIHKLGAKVYYLTARNHATMYEGTIQSLRKWGFPLENEKYLTMKENPEMQDAVYKAGYLKKWTKQFDTILFFENEPVVLNEVYRAVPDVYLFWMNSTHSQREEPPKNALPLDMNYIY